MTRKLKIGTRGSPLALYQAELVKAQLLRQDPSQTVEIIKIKTSGDTADRTASGQPLTKRIFTKEIEESLLAGTVDLAVHSAKDMSAVLPDGLAVGAALKREDLRDCLISKTGQKLKELKDGSSIGTGSLRRRMQLLKIRPQVNVLDLHGNVGTRLRKLDEGSYDGIVLAYAGMKRLGLSDRVTEIFSEDLFLPAPGQGIIAVEIREGDLELQELLKPLHHEESGIQLDCERGFLKGLGGGCQLPCGMHTRLENGKLTARGILFHPAEGFAVEALQEGTPQKAGECGEALAAHILASGGNEILTFLNQKKSS